MADDDHGESDDEPSSDDVVIAIAVNSDNEEDNESYDNNDITDNDSTNIVTAEVIHATTEPSMDNSAHHDGSIVASCCLVEGNDTEEEAILTATATSVNSSLSSLVSAASTPLLASATPLNHDYPLSNVAHYAIDDDNISPYLFDLIRQGPPHPNNNDDPDTDHQQQLKDWTNEIIQLCTNHPEQTWYISTHTLSKRTCLHEVCLLYTPSCPLKEVIMEIINANPNAICQVDGSGNTPLHLLFAPSPFFSVSDNNHLNNDDTIKEEEELFHIITFLLQTAKRAIGLYDVTSIANDDGCTPLHIACQNDILFLTTDVISLLLSPCSSSRKFICSLCDKHDGFTPFAQYCYTISQQRRIHQRQRFSERKIVEITNLFLQENPQAMATRDKNGSIPLFYPTMFMHPILLQTLLDWNDQHYRCNTEGAGYQEHPPSSILSLQNNAGQNLLHVACRYQPHSINNDHDESNKEETQNFLTVLHKLVTALPSTSLSQFDKTSKNQTPLHILCERGILIPESVSLLLNTKAQCQKNSCMSDKMDVNAAATEALRTDKAAYMVDSSGYTPLHCVCRRSIHRRKSPILQTISPLVVQLLISANPKATSQKLTTHGEDTPLHLAAENIGGFGCLSSSFEVLKMLIDSYPQALKIRNAYGYTPLHCAARANFFPDSNGTTNDSDNTNMEGDNDDNEAVGIIHLLMDSYSDALWMKTNGGETPLHLACHNGNIRLAVVRALLEGSSAYCNIIDNGGPNGAIGRADKNFTSENIIAGNPDCKKSSCSTTKMTTMVNKVGNTPLHEACFRRSSAQLIQLLTTFHPPWINELNNMGYTPLHLAVKSAVRDVDIIRALLGADVPSSSMTSSPSVVASIADKSGHFPLHSACHAGSSIDVVQLLVEVFPNALFATTQRGDTPLHLVVLRDAPIGTMRFLVERIQRIIHEDNATMIKMGLMKERTPLLWRNGGGNTILDMLMNRYWRHCRSLDEIGVARVREKALLVIEAIGYGASGCNFSNRSSEWRKDRKARNLKAPPSANLQSPPPPILHAALSVGLQSDHNVLDEEFLLSVMKLHPEHIHAQDEWGNYPLHIEAGLTIVENHESNNMYGGKKEENGFFGASIPSGTAGAQMRRSLQYQIQRQEQRQQIPIVANNTISCPIDRIGLLEKILNAFPNAARKQNTAGEFPLSILASSRRSWGGNGGIKSVLAAYPPALCWDGGVPDLLFPHILSKLGKENDRKTLLWILKSKPDLIDYRKWY